MRTRWLGALWLCFSYSCSVSGHAKCGQGYRRCGEKLCCCKGLVAVCKDYEHRLKYIPKFNRTITQLVFTNNSLQNVDVHTFTNLNTFTKLILNFNRIRNISSDAFRIFPNLEELSLDGNILINKTQLSLAFGSIHGGNNITISLCGMMWSTIERWLFKYLQNACVVSVQLVRNQLKSLDFEAFKALQCLRSISADENHIRDITVGNGHPTLTDLRLSNNEIARNVPKFCYNNESMSPFPALNRLDLSYNFISELDSQTWRCMSRLQYLDLDGNVIRKVPERVFSTLVNLRRLNFGGMSCNLQMIYSHAFQNDRLQHLRIRENSISSGTLASLEILNGLPNLQWLDISGNNFRDFTENQFVHLLSPLTNLVKLNAKNCKINSIPGRIVKPLTNLKTVILDENHIETLDAEFLFAASISYLSLQSNRIKLLEKSSLSTNFQTTPKEINLAQNPFDCTCEMLWFRSSISNNGKLGSVTFKNWPTRYTCASPSRMKHKRILDFHPTEIACKNILLIVLIYVASFVLLISIVAILAYRYRWNIQLWLYRMKPRKKDTERQPLLDGPLKGFRGYVIYDMEDRSFVHNDLRILVEKRMQYNLKIWGINGELGGAELEDMADSIYDSEHVIAVLSKVSLANEWVRFQIDVALHRKLEIKRNNLMLVLLGDIDFAALSKHWCVIFTRLPTARWCEDDTDIRRRVFEQQLSQHLGVEIKPAATV